MNANDTIRTNAQGLEAAKLAAQPTHTPEPWRVRRSMGGDIDIISGVSSFVATVGKLAKPDLDAEEDDQIHDDSDRIVACVNACAGIADPQDALTKARRIPSGSIADLEGLRDEMATRSGMTEWRTDLKDRLDALRAALAALGGGK